MNEKLLPEQGLKTDSAARVLVFGGSITQGFHDNEGLGWANRLRRHYDTTGLKDITSAQPTIFNLGILGDTIEKILLRIEPETMARSNPGEDLAYIFSVGTNNAATNADGSPRSTPFAYADGLNILFDRARVFSGRLMCVGLTPVDESRTTPVHWDENTHYTNTRISKFDNTMRKTCENEGVLYVPVFEPIKQRFDKGEAMFTHRDGLHPNSAAHELIAQLVRPELDKLLGDSIVSMKPKLI